VLEKGDELWLASGTPKRWLESPEGVEVNSIETYFGPVSYSVHSGSQAGVIEATVQTPTRNPAKKTWLVARVPHGSVQSVLLNGKPWKKFDPNLGAIEIPQGDGAAKLEIRYR